MPSRKAKPHLGAASTLVRSPRFVERSLTIAAVLVAVGIVLDVIGIEHDDTTGTVIASLGSILLTVGLLSVLYDAYLKSVLLGEIYAAIGIEKNLQEIDLRRVVRHDQEDLSEVLNLARKVDALPLDPTSWSKQDWPRIVDVASSSQVRVKIYLPNHDSPHIDVLAKRLGDEPGELAKQIARLPDELGRSWDQKEASALGSELEILLYAATPAIGILRTDRQLIIEMPPSLGYGTSDRSTLSFVFGDNGWSPLVRDFVDEQLAEQRVPEISRSISKTHQ